MPSKFKTFVWAICLILICICTNSYAAPFVYVGNFNEGTVSIIDAANNTVVNTLAVGANPYGVAVHPDGSQAYVTNLFDPEEVKIISAITHKIVGTIAMGTDVQPTGLTIHPNGSLLYVAKRKEGTVSVVDTATNTITNTITVGAGASAVAINPAGTFVYVTNSNADTVSVIDTSNNTVVDTLNVGVYPHDLVFNRSGSRLYIASGFETTEPRVSVLDPSDNSVIATIDFPLEPQGLAVHPLETKYYVSSEGRIYVVDATTNAITTSLALDQYVYSLDVNPAGTFLYATAWGAGPGLATAFETVLGAVYVIDTQNNTVVAELLAGDDPRSLGRFIGPAPALSLSRNAIDFGNQRVDTRSGDETVTLTNIGSMLLNINSIDGDLGDFLLDHDCPLELPANDFCTITVAFEPLEKGAQTATISIASNTNESPQTFTLTGTGTVAGGCSLIAR